MLTGNSETGCERDEFRVPMGRCAAESFKMEEIQVLNATGKDPVENERLDIEERK